MMRTTRAFGWILTVMMISGCGGGETPPPVHSKPPDPVAVKASSWSWRDVQACFSKHPENYIILSSRQDGVDPAVSVDFEEMTVRFDLAYPLDIPCVVLDVQSDYKFFLGGVVTPIFTHREKRFYRYENGKLRELDLLLRKNAEDWLFDFDACERRKTCAVGDREFHDCLVGCDSRGREVVLARRVGIVKWGALTAKTCHPNFPNLSAMAPDDPPEMWQQRGVNSFAAEGREEEALLLLAEAEKRGSWDGESLGMLARLHEKQGRLAEALEYYRKSAEAYGKDQPFPKAYYETLKRMGILVRATGGLARAAELLSEAGDGLPEDAEIWKNLAETQAMLGRLHDALASYKKALHANPAADFIRVAMNHLDEKIRDR